MFDEPLGKIKLQQQTAQKPAEDRWLSKLHPYLIN